MTAFRPSTGLGHVACLVLLLTGLAAPRPARGAGVHAALPQGAAGEGAGVSGTGLYEPAVTRREAELLARAAEIGADDPQAAAVMLQKILLPSNSAALDFALGNFLYQSEQLEGAEQAYAVAIAKLPLFRAALSNLARVYLARENYASAMTTFQRLIETGQGDADTYLLLGHCLLLQDQPVSAEGAYRHTLLLHPGEPDALRGLIKSLIAQQRTREVLALTRELQTRYPCDEELWTLRANAHLALDEIDEAVRAIETAGLLQAAPASLLAVLGDLHLNREQVHDAVGAYREALARGVLAPEQMLQAADGLLFYEATDEAEDLLERARAAAEQGDGFSASQRTRFESLQARIVLQRGEVEQARTLYESILRRDPLHGATVLALADLYITGGRVDDAEILLERAARVEGFEAKALVRRAQLAVEAGRYEDAVPLLESALAFDDQPAVTRYLEQVRRLVPR